MIPPRFVWLHGFASGPSSSKAGYVRARLAERGVLLAVPDLNLPSFRELTVGRMLAQVDGLRAEAGGAPLVLCGSSLGGYTAAAWAAKAGAGCAALVLLAPAFALGPRWTLRMDPAEVALWRGQGELSFPHYAWGRKEPLGSGFLDDALARDDYPLPSCPTLLLQGLRDEVVEPDLAREFTRRMRAAGRPAKLVELDDGHQLTADLPRLWAEIESFLAPFLPG